MGNETMGTRPAEEMCELAVHELDVVTGGVEGNPILDWLLSLLHVPTRTGGGIRT